MYVLPDIFVNTKRSSWSTSFSTRTESRSAAAWPPLRLCYRPAVVFRYFSLVLKNCVNLNLRQSSSVVTCISSRMSCHLFWRRYFRLKHMTTTWQRSSVPSTCRIGAVEVVELDMEVRIFVHTVRQTIHPFIYSRKDHEGLVYQEALQRWDEFQWRKGGAALERITDESVRKAVRAILKSGRLCVAVAGCRFQQECRCTRSWTSDGVKTS